MIALLVCSSKGPRDGCSLGLWCPQVSDGGEHAHGLTAHDTLIARGVLWQEGGEGDGGGGAGCANSVPTRNLALYILACQS